MLKIYGSDLSYPANKVRFVANALGLKYEYIRVNLREGEHLKPEFLAINPVGKIPAIDDDGFRMMESNAIIKYLADKNNSPLYPRDIKQRAIIDMWIDFSSMHVGGASSKVVYNRLFAAMRGIPVDENSLKEGLQWLDRFLPVVDGQLKNNAFLCGAQMTIADLNLLAILDPSEAAQIDLSKYASLTKWRNGLRAQSFYTQVHKEYGESLKQAVKK